jgi:DNA-binding NtrC family response regulator
MNKPVTGFSSEAMEHLKAYDWPGNIRELRNAVERAVVVATAPTITAEQLPIPRTPKATARDQSLDAVEQAHIKNILEQVGWNITRASEVLGIDRTTLYNKIEKYGLRK